MRDRTRNLPSSVLALSFLLLLAIPLVASAQSDDLASLRLRTDAGADGAGIEVVGLGFPSDTTVVLELVTPAGPYPLATVATDGTGAFRDVLSVPPRVYEAALRLDARSASGASASHELATAGVIEAVAAQPGPNGAEPARAGRPGQPAAVASDDIVLVLIAIVLGTIATAALYAYRAVSDDWRRPGMGAGDDLIWGGNGNEAKPEPTATDEPFWKRRGSEAAEAVSEAAGRAVPAREQPSRETSTRETSTREAPTSA